MSKLDGERSRELLVDLVSRWLDHGGKKGDLLETVGRIKGVNPQVLTSWFAGFLRGYRIWEEWLRMFCSKPPRRKIRALLLAAMAVVWNARTESRPIQVNEWVRLARGQLSKAEAGLVNAVLRRMLREGEGLLADWCANESTWGVGWSHPDWLVQRWIRELGQQTTLRLLQWNQQIPSVYMRWVADEPPAASFSATLWEDFYMLPAEWKSYLELGQAYIQDPATRLSVQLLDRSAHPPLSEEASLMEWCASPGGKSLLLADARRRGTGMLQHVKRHVAVDLSGPKLEMLRHNLSRYPFAQEIDCLGENVLQLTAQTLLQHQLPATWDIVLVDAPCSNTGVMARKPEVRYRLTPESIQELSVLQQQMLEAAAGWVRAGGWLLYSTCSIEPEENERRVAHFLERHPQWWQVAGMRWLPQDTGHDGGGAFLLQKSE